MKTYTCLQCGPDPRGADQHAWYMHTFAGMGGEPYRCCDMHNEHCEPPSELCCNLCPEFHHGLHGCGPDKRTMTSHHDGSVCVLVISEQLDSVREEESQTAFADAALKLYQAQLGSVSIVCDICDSETEFTTDGMRIMVRHLDTHD